MISLWIVLAGILTVAILTIFVKRRKGTTLKFPKQANNDGVLVQLATLEERTKQLQSLGEKIEKVRDKQDVDSKELRDKLYNEYSKRLQDSVDLLKDTYGKMNATTANAFREITNRNAEVYQQTATQLNSTTASAFKEITNRNVEIYKQTAAQLHNMTEKLEAAFKMLEEREHSQMREELEALRRKINELERDPLKVQLEELGEARTAQAVHEQSVKKITALFWPNNGEVKFNERIGQYVPDVYIANHKLKIVADEVTTEDLNSVREKVRKVAEYMRGLNTNVGYVIIPNAGVDPEDLREIKRTVSERGLYVVRITEYAVHLQVWYDVATTGVVDMGSLVEKGHNFLQVLEPIFDQFLAIVQNLEQRDERDFKYRQNRYKEIKFFPGKLLETIEKASRATD
jgi:polyhydroxyalkanoate synthesis regulator phasin